MSLFKITPWEIIGTAGGSATLTIPALKLGGGGGYVKLKLRNERTSERVVVHCGGIVGGAAVGVSLPINLDGSLSAFPSGGIGKIVSIAEEELKPEDFGGTAMIVSGTCKGIGGGQLSLIIFKRALPSIPQELSLADVWRLIDSSKAVGLYAGLVMGTSIQALGIEFGGYATFPVKEPKEESWEDAAPKPEKVIPAHKCF